MKCAAGAAAALAVWMTLGIQALPAGAAAAPAVNASAAVAGLERALAGWDLRAARDLLGSLPPDRVTEAAYYRARIAFLSGNYRKAVELFEALPRQSDREGALAGETALARNSLELSRRLTLRESEHFRLFYDAARDGLLAEPAAAALEAAYESLGGWLDWRPEEKVRVEIVPDAASFERITGLGRRRIEGAGAVGLCKFNRIMILSPRVLLRGYRWRDSLVHEYVHFLLVRLSGGRAPVWLQEGSATYADTLWRSGESLWLGREEESLLAVALRRGELFSLSDLRMSLVDLPTLQSVRLAFSQCALAVEYLVRTWGAAGLRDLLEKMAVGSGAHERGAMAAALGVDPEGFEKGWLGYLRGRGFREESPGQRAYRLGAAAHGETAGEGDVGHLQSLEARRHLTLGDMLRKRQRHSAALKEYRKALAHAPLSPYVLNRLGRTMLHLSERAGAEEAFTTAAENAPDYPASYANLAEVRALDGRWEESRRALEEYLEINPFNPTVWKDLGSVHMELGEPAAALAHWETALRLNPADPELRRVLGRP